MMSALWNLNTRVFEAIHSLANGPALARDFGVVCAEYLPYFIVFLFVLLLVMEPGMRKRYIMFATAAIAIIISRGIITEWMHAFIQSPRPFVAYGFEPLIAEASNSLPSGHAAFFFALAAAVFVYNRGWGIAFGLLAVLNGFARIMVGVHWPTDVLAGAIVGIFSAWVSWRLMRAPYRAVVTKTAAKTN